MSQKSMCVCVQQKEIETREGLIEDGSDELGWLNIPVRSLKTFKPGQVGMRPQKALGPVSL